MRRRAEAEASSVASSALHHSGFCCDRPPARGQDDTCRCRSARCRVVSSDGDHQAARPRRGPREGASSTCQIRKRRCALRSHLVMGPASRSLAVSSDFLQQALLPRVLQPRGTGAFLASKVCYESVSEVSLPSIHRLQVVLLPLVFRYYKVYGSPEDRYAGFDIVGVLNRHSVIPLPKLARISAGLSFLYLVSDFFWYGALADVSVAAGVAISNSSPLFVYCLSVCLLNEHLNVNKIVGVFTAFAGVSLVVMFQDGSDFGTIEASTITAGISMIISAALYAGYQVAMRLAIGDEITHTSTLLTMAGLCGLFTFPPWILGTFILSESPFSWLHESLTFPGTLEGALLLVVGGLLTVVFCAFLPLAICWTSPLETSVGCMLTIPLSGLMDTVMHHTVFSWECIVGSVLVMGGFAILECSTKKKSPLPQQKRIPNASAWA